MSDIKASDLVGKLVTGIEDAAGSALDARTKAILTTTSTILGVAGDELTSLLATKVDVATLYDGINDMENGAILLEQGGVKIAHALKGPAALEAAANA